MTKEILNYFRREKELLEKLNFDIPDVKDYEIMKIVYDSLSEIQKPICNERLTLEKCKLESLNDISLLNKDYRQRLTEKMFVINTTNDEYNFSTAILNRYNKKKQLLTSKKAVGCYIIVPPTLNELSPIWISHEYIHTLKDVKYDEFKSVYSEVISLFYEILVANNKVGDIHEKWKQARLYMFWSDKMAWDYCIKRYNIEEDEVYKYICDSYGKYFLNYYYAVNLYSEYKENPKLILKYVNRVLDNRITTVDLLKKLKLDNMNISVNRYLKEYTNI